VGFSAIAVALRAPHLGDLQAPSNRWRLGMLFLLGLGALMFSLVPSILSSGEVAEPLVWKISSGLFCIYFLSVSAVARSTGARLLDDAESTKRAMFFGLVIHSVAIASLAANSVLWGNPGLYLVFVVVALGLSLWSVLYFIFPPEDTSAGGDAA